MQRQAKQMIAVLALLLVFGAAYGGMRIYNRTQQEKESERKEAQKLYLADVKKEDISAFSYQNGDDTLEFVKEGEEWISKNEEGMKLNQASVESMLDGLVSLTAEETVEGAGSFSEYGLDSPQNVITVTTADGTLTLRIGMENTVTGQYYLAKGEEETLYLVSGSFPSVFKKELSDLEDTSAETEEADVTETK